MEKHILSLIKENNRVIIPNFGAFIVAKENGFTILFNNFLSFNDGLLIDYVASTESIPKEEANKKVEKYVENVKSELDSKGQFIIKGLGTFTKDATGILRFAQADEINDHEEPENDLLDLDNSVNEEEKDEIVVQTEMITTNESIVNEEPLVVEEKKEEPLAERPTSTDITNKYIVEDQKKRNRSIFVFLIVFVLIPILGVIIYFSFFSNEKEPVKKEVKTKPVIEEKKVEDTLKLDIKPQGDVVASPEVKKEEKATVIKPVEINKPHHIIVGSFKNLENAERYMKSLQTKGFDNCAVIEHNTMTLVSIGSFRKVYEAQKRQEEILDKYRIESWILTKRK